MIELLLTDNDYPPGVYQLQSDVDTVELCAAAEETGWECVKLDGQHITNKSALLTVVAQAFQFPDYFGRNWDALNDMLTDLSWLPAAGYVIVWDQAHELQNSSPQDWSTAVEIFQDMAAFWWSRGIPTFVLLAGSVEQAELPLLPRSPA